MLQKPTALPICLHFIGGRERSSHHQRDWFFSHIMMMNGYFCSERSQKTSQVWMHRKLLWQRGEKSSRPPLFSCCLCVAASALPSHPHPSQCSVCAAVARPDLDTDFNSDPSLFDLNLAEGCMTLLPPADTARPRLGFYWLLVFHCLCLSTRILFIFFLSSLASPSRSFVFWDGFALARSWEEDRMWVD